MKPSTVLTILYGLNLVTALVGAGFLAAFLGQLYADDPLLVFQLPVAIWVSGVAAFFGLLIAYLVVWIIFRVSHFESGFSTVVGDTCAILLFLLAGVASAAGLTSENVFRLNCREQPMWSDVLALCLPAAIGASIAWGQVGLLLLTLAYIVIAMRDYPDGWKESMYSLSNPRRVKPIIHLDKTDTNSPASSFGSPYSTMERRPLVGVIPDYPPRGAPGRDHTHRPSDSISSGSFISSMSPLSPASPPSPSDSWPSRWGTPAPPRPGRLPAGGMYAAYADALPTNSYWIDDQAIRRPQPSLEMDRLNYRPSEDLERLVTPSSPPRSRLAPRGHCANVSKPSLRSLSTPSSPGRLVNPPPLPMLPTHAQHLQTPPYEPGFGGTRPRSDSASSQLSRIEADYKAAALEARPLSRDFETVSVKSNAPSWLQSPGIYPPEKYTYTYEKPQPLTPPPLTPPMSTPARCTTPTELKTLREFSHYGSGLPPLPPAWGVDESAREQEHQRQLERAREAEIVARAHRKMSLEVENAGPSRHGPSRRPSEVPSSSPPRRPQRTVSDYSEFGYPSEARRPRRTSKLPPPILPGEALALPLPRPEWEPRVKRPPGFQL
ncbi:hypothetical protein CC85DRAFT_286010 [Cutaneotrichosporon oleaginosum]|uniref:MARVEL domain-containing protein n=1 Tax=Cutaneotrichosporon oleaginosum TaxID=879819 RepID=A0A0J0XLG0_9TREE|nr:uncharacterized protein CC85DRAFT_286010 [Cutaneotrichosporon oleaginosum]KLT41921.1 hypothetical protein CC85DRAFT_286010 [Cutaneotrichosporon oleaginosum]TXT12521.1 hypothetical protein COLE_02931 [Cutaneotrichosporon oleaginosum]